MKQIMFILAVASAAGFAYPAWGQQAQTGGEPPQSAAEPAATQAAAEQPQPRSPEETLADHRNSFLARVQERLQAADDTEVDTERQQGIRYHPAW